MVWLPWVMDMRFMIGKKTYEDGQLPVHKHNHFELFIYRKGSGELQADGVCHAVRAGDLVVMPPGVMHCTVATKGLEYLHISGDFRSIFPDHEPIMVSDRPDGDGVALADMIFRSQHQQEEFMNSLVICLCNYILQNLNPDDALTSAVHKITAKIKEEFHNCHLDLAQLLRESGYAEDYIRAAFKRITGKTPTAFLTHTRIRHACYLIDVYHSAIPLADIANRCGYVDYVLFSKKFKEVTDRSPRAYKKNLI